MRMIVIAAGLLLLPPGLYAQESDGMYYRFCKDGPHRVPIHFESKDFLAGIWMTCNKSTIDALRVPKRLIRSSAHLTHLD